MNQYQACLYLYQCISHGDSKYCHEIPPFWHFWQFCIIFELSSAHACRVESINKTLEIQFACTIIVPLCNDKSQNICNTDLEKYCAMELQSSFRPVKKWNKLSNYHVSVTIVMIAIFSRQHKHSQDMVSITLMIEGSITFESLIALTTHIL